MTRYRVIKTEEGEIQEPIELGGEEIMLFNVKDVAEIYGLHPQTIYEAVRAGRIPAHKVGWTWIFVSTELPDQWPEA